MFDEMAEREGWDSKGLGTESSPLAREMGEGNIKLNGMKTRTNRKEKGVKLVRVGKRVPNSWNE